MQLTYIHNCHPSNYKIVFWYRNCLEFPVDNVAPTAAIHTILVFCMLDLDNFKSYNDRYGYAKGNEVIKATAVIIETAVAEHGGKDDFAGHIGGDDFAVITTAEKYEQICNTIITGFDENIVFFYNTIDRTRGSIVSKNRRGEEMLFPLMTISIGVVTNEKGGKLTKQNEAMVLENRDLKAALEKLEMLDLRLEAQRQNF